MKEKPVKRMSTEQLDRFGHGRALGYRTLTNVDSQPYVSIGCGPNLELEVYLHHQYMNVWVGEGQSNLRPYLIPHVETLAGWHPDPDPRDRFRRFFYAEADCDQILTDLASYVGATPLPEDHVDGRLAKRLQRAH